MTVSLLIVDDDDMILRALRGNLASEGWSVSTCNDPHAALRILEHAALDIIVSDFEMPGMSGVDLLAAARRQQPEARRILMTGHADRAVTIRAINEGKISHYIEKPWNDDELKRVLREAAAASGARRALEAVAANPAAAVSAFTRDRFLAMAALARHP